MKNLNDGTEQNDNLSLEAVRFAWGTTPIAWEKIRQPAAKNRLPLNVDSGSRRLNEESEQSEWSLMESVCITFTVAIRRLLIIASSLSERLTAWKITASHFQQSDTHEEKAR